MDQESKKKIDVNQIYTHESALLERLDQITSSDLSKQELLAEFTSLGAEYQKLLRKTVKITRVGDSTQMKLMRMLELEKEKLRLEEVVKERTEEIEEKNQRLEVQTIQLRELADSKSRFFANISHEFRTPLTLIMGPLEQILASDPSSQLRGKANLMLRNSRRLLNLVNQLLELARFDSGTMKLEASRQKIFPFVRNIVMCFESMASQHDVTLRIQGDEYSEDSLWFDPEKLERIITNLLSNAFNFTPGGGEIVVSIHPVPDEDSIEISVCDTGTGIPAEQLPHIFDRFYRGKNNHEYRRKGTGIGLALTKDLVELHSGSIIVESSCGNDHSRGTKFVLRFPNKRSGNEGSILEEADMESAGAPLPLAGAPGLSAPYAFLAESMDDAEETVDVPTVHADQPQENNKDSTLILVVEDNADVRTHIKSTLEPAFKIAEAADGLEGIERAKELIPDLIISDIMMPNIDGNELCRVLKKEPLTCHIPIILLTARVADKNMLEGLKSGADDYISKPFSSGILTSRIKNLIQLRRQLQLKHKNRVSFMPDQVNVSHLDEKFYRQVEDVLEEHLANPDFGVEAFSQRFHMSQATLYRKVQALTGQSPTRLIRSYRLKRAAQMLRDRAGSISYVAKHTGFSNRSYFTRCFKEQFFCLPSDFCTPGVQDSVVSGDAEPVTDATLTWEARMGKDIILVVEDSEDARNYIRDSLEPDFRVVEAENGSEGIARAIELIPDLIISDIMMPDTDGYQLCETLKKDVRTSHTPIILLTAKASEESIIKGLDTGADDYITKPFNTDILRARIKNLIQLRNHLQIKRCQQMSMMPTEIAVNDADQEFMRDLNQVIKKNLSESEFNVEQLAHKLYMSNATIYRKILALTGEIPSEYLRSCRLKEAANLLRNKFSVTEAAFQVGFSSRAYFTRCFKEKFHQLPSVYVAAQAN